MADKNKPIKKGKPAKDLVVKKRSNSLSAWVCVAVIAIVTYLVFSPSLQNDFTNWDDYDYVVNNPLVANNSVQVAKIFETPVSLHYHPLTVLSLALNYQTGKLDPSGYHLWNVLLHVLDTILVFVFIFLLTRRNVLMASIVALFFGIHPMHVESVAWVSERKDVLYVLFFMAGLITYLRYSETRKIAWYIFALLFFILSCLSKEMAIVFPVILLLIDYLRGVKWSRKVFIEKIPFFIVAIIVGIVEVKIQAGNAGSDVKLLTAFQRLLFASYASIMYVVRLFVPFKLSAFYPYPDMLNNGIPLIYYLSPFMLLILLITSIYFFLKKQKEIVFGLLFYFVTIVLVVQFIPIGPAMVPDRYSYLSYVGLLFVVAYIVNKAWQSNKGAWAAIKYPLILIVIIGATLFSVQTYSRTQVWKNSGVLWTNVIENYPSASEAYDHRAEYYYSSNDKDSALADYNKASQTDPSDRDVFYNRGILYGSEGKDNLAVADYSKAIALDSAFKKAYFNRALIYTAYGKNESAIADLTKAINADPAFSDAYINRGLLYSNSGRNDLAMADFNKAIALDSTDADAYNNRGLIYLRSNKIDLALVYFNKAISFNRNSAPYFYNRGLCYKITNEYEKAANDFTTAINLNPPNVEMYYNMRGLCNSDLQDYTAAIADFSKAIAINPSVRDFWLNRSSAESKAGQNDNAKADALQAQHLN